MSRREFTENERKRIWDSDRKPWEGNEASIEILKKKIWRSLYFTTDRRHQKFTASEISAASLLVSQEAVNHGAVERGFVSVYDVDETNKAAKRLLDKYQSNRREYISKLQADTERKR
jgi:D-Tyr-tRNAtyr deacylase